MPDLNNSRGKKLILLQVDLYTSWGKKETTTVEAPIVLVIVQTKFKSVVIFRWFHGANKCTKRAFCTDMKGLRPISQHALLPWILSLLFLALFKHNLRWHNNLFSPFSQQARVVWNTMHISTAALKTKVTETGKGKYKGTQEKTL